MVRNARKEKLRRKIWYRQEIPEILHKSTLGDVISFGMFGKLKLYRALRCVDSEGDRVEEQPKLLRYAIIT